MLMIRLQRVGRKNEPVFRVVLTDSKNGPKSGKFLEILGSYDSRRAEKAEIKTDRIKELMSKGAKTSGTVHNLLVGRKLVTGKKINVLPKKKPIKKEGEEAPVAEAAPAAEAVASSEPTPEVATETPAEAPVQV